MSLPSLAAGEFAAFFEAVHEKTPFPWQCRLAARVFERGWDEALDVPTGAGKTSALDVALFHLALEVDRRGGRNAAVRIVFVVDRRLVVDDAHERAETLRKKLEASLANGTTSADVVRRVALRLARLSEHAGRPLATVRLRGGAPQDPDWVRTPSQPVIVVSTVDQVGSRLLFRGYGVSDSMKPVHAGLFGADALYLLDEAHLSQPFVQTMRDTIALGDGSWVGFRKPFSIVTLSATQTEQTHPLLGQDDREHPHLGPRLTRPKPTTLEPMKGAADDDAFTAALAEQAWRCSELGGGGARLIAVVANRVRRARRVFEWLDEKVRALGPGEARPEVILLLGRSRPLDRDDVLAAYLPRMRAAGRDAEEGKTLFVVGTQCIEAGADLDFDALVTEIAPLDCLRQRFGRLNRMGRRVDARGVIVAASEQVSGKAKPDPIYERALLETWSLLEAKATKVAKALEIDFGIQAAEAWLPARDELARYVAPRRDAPVMLPAFLEQWQCTSPVPAVDPEIALFLHGPETGPGDVEIVWRADLDAADLDADTGPDEDAVERAWTARLAACPPSSLEAVSVPLAEAVRWLGREARGDVADLEATEALDVGLSRVRRRVFRWRGADAEQTGFVGANALRAGDRIVVPATVGGCDRWGWEPRSKAPVRDLGARANRLHRGRDVLRLSPSLLAAELTLEAADATERRATEPERRARAKAFEARLEALREVSDREVSLELAGLKGMPDVFREFWARGGREPEVLRDDEGLPIALERREVERDGGPRAESLAATEDDEGSRGSGQRAIPLRVHAADVCSVARHFAAAAGLSAELVEDVAMAGFLHDAGKARIEFKRWLYGGDELAALGGDDLAKSGQRYLPRSARERSGLPAGARHEIASLSFAGSHPKLAEANDRDLVLWLIGTHHGYGRPFFPPVEWPPPGARFEADLGDGRQVSEPAPSLAELTARWMDLHEKLARRYGPWGLARLEAILRLADHRASEAEQEA